MTRVSLQSLLDRSVKRMGSGMNSVVKESALEMIRRAYKEGINVQITDGFRSFAEQTKLYNQGRTTPGQIVTNARAGQSNHNYGLAVDFVLLSEDGTKALYEVNSKWRRVAAIGKSLGFEWGGDWTSFKDYPHLEMMGGLSIRDLQNGKRPSLRSKVSDKVSVPKETEKETKPSKSSGDNAAVKKFQSWLNDNYGTGIEEDGYTGPKTRKAALKALQKEFNKQFGSKLVVDGVWGPKTAAACKVVAKNARGNITKIIQGLLYCAGLNPKGFDGIFGSGCEAAVKSFQKSHGLSSDGKVGKNTFKALLS